MGYLDGKTLFVAGGTGCAGGNIIDRLLADYPGVRVRATKYRHTPVFIRDPRVEYVPCELKNLDEARGAARGCDCAVMVAANTAGAGVIAQSPSSFVTDNAIMVAQMLEAFHLESIQRVVYVSSASLYQEFDGHIREDQLDMNQDPPPAFFGYGWVARFAEKLCEYWHLKHGMNVAVLRGANIFGPYDKFNPVKSHFIPALIRKAVDGMDPFEVWGSPDVTRDVLYAPDFARAVLMAMDRDEFEFDTYNLCSGDQVRVGDVVDWALEAAGHKPSGVRYLPDKPTTIRFRAFDPGKIRAKLGWAPEYNAREAIRKTTEWWRANKETWTK